MVIVSSKSNFYLISFATSLLLAIMGIVLLILQFSVWITLLGLVLMVVGLVQVIADLGWLVIVKINANLATWKEAYPIVAKQRTQKLFLVPFTFDICFVVLSLGLFIIYGIKV